MLQMLTLLVCGMTLILTGPEMFAQRNRLDQFHSS